MNILRLLWKSMDSQFTFTQQPIHCMLPLSGKIQLRDLRVRGEGWLGKITQMNWKFSDGHYSVKATTLLFYVDAIFLLF